VTSSNFRAAETRASGILLHPTSLPSKHGVGDLGAGLFRWLDWLAESGCTLWQVLPLGPTGFGDSPYQSFSAAAGNPVLIDLFQLAEIGLLGEPDLVPHDDIRDDKVEYGAVLAYKRQRLARAASNFCERASSALQQEYQSYCEQNKHWLDGYAGFMTIKDAHEGHTWTEWPTELAHRDPEALAARMEEFHQDVESYRLEQFFFYLQWMQVRKRASELGIKIIGDIPIFVAHDSSDVWMRPEKFDLSRDGNPRVVAGVPPDYFSETGQRWGNPLYQWERMKANRFEWWLDRFRSVLSMVDVVRLDHFRGFEGFWEIPAASPTAVEGRWVKAPGQEFFRMLAKELGSLPIIAEDLGVITPEVEALRDEFDLPGMRVLQFAFASDANDPFLPHNYPNRCVVYTGTHDNDTTVGWYTSVPESERDACRRYLSSDGSHIAWDLIRAAWGSVANWAIAPMQDFLELGTEARMNYPGRPYGNWDWRVREADLTSQLANRIRALNEIFGR
jgi:4-alpha-glucanotransferase